MGEAAVLAAVPAVESANPWARANELAGELNRLYAALVAVTVSVIAADDWGAHGGIRSPEHWLSLRAGLAPATASQVVAIARRAAMLPLTIGLLTDGQLSLDQAAVIARHVPASYETSVIELAPKLTVAQLRRALSRYPFETADSAGAAGVPADPRDTDLMPHANAGASPDHSGCDDAADARGESRTGPALSEPDGSADDAATPACADDSPEWHGEPSDEPSGEPLRGRTFGIGTEEARPELAESAARASLPGGLTTWWDSGRFYVRGDLPADLGALVEQALKEARDALFTAGETKAGPPDALAEMANRSLATVEPVSRADRYRIYVHLDEGGAWLNARGAIPRHLAERYACISAHAAVFERDGKPVSVGRTRRGIPSRTRRLVEDRDRGCAYPGCTATRFVEIHHLQHWEDGGGTDYDNLICLCPHHHTGHHQGAFTIAPAVAPASEGTECGASARGTCGPDRHDLRHFTFTDNRGRPIHVQPPPRRQAPSAGSDGGSDAGPSSGTGVGWPANSGGSAVPVTGATYRGPLGEHLDLGWVRFYRDTDPFRPAPRTWSPPAKAGPGDEPLCGRENSAATAATHAVC